MLILQDWMNTSGLIMAEAAPTIAMSHSPRRRLCTARCAALSADEQAVSTVRHGPRRSSRCAIRPAAAESELPSPKYGSSAALMPSASSCRMLYCMVSISPANTPVRLPRSSSAVSPASSMPSQTSSISSRNVGSSRRASWGDRPKNPASHPAMSPTNAPCWV